MPTRAERVAAGTILGHVERSRRDIKREVDAAIVAAAALLHTRGRLTLTHAAALTAVLDASRRLALTLVPILGNVRRLARGAGANRLRLELAANGAGGYAHAAPVDSVREDDARATMAAEGLAAGWRGLAVAAVVIARHKEKDAAKAVLATRDGMVHRIGRTASTEVATAYGDERAAILKATSEDREFLGLAKQEFLLRQWCAMVDACPKCWPLDGSQARLDGDFDHGEMPGYVHIHCQCFDVIVSADAKEYAEAA